MPMKKEFLEELEIEQSGIDLLIRASYKLLGLISFRRQREDETRAWTIKRNEGCRRSRRIPISLAALSVLKRFNTMS